MDTTVPFANREDVERLLDYPSLLERIRDAFLDPPTIPQRTAIPISQTEMQPGGTVLVMPAVRTGGLIGVKIITIHPGLTGRPGGATRAIYVALNAGSGDLIGLIDGHALTLRRTAATSLLAAQALAPATDTVLVMGTGSLAQTLAQAYAEIFRPRQLLIWGRRESRANALVATLRNAGIQARAVSDLPAALRCAQLVTCATLSKEPIVEGRYISPGTHVDLVGGFTREMREGDDDLLKRALVVADVEATLLEAGDLAQPLDRQLIRREAILMLRDVLRGKQARTSPSDITVFKSAGNALEDLAGAELLFRRWQR
jgi:ornithine cyclodeaminase/alanine dehydrogenase-like protein (mu-crystallin family)